MSELIADTPELADLPVSVASDGAPLPEAVPAADPRFLSDAQPHDAAGCADAAPGLEAVSVYVMQLRCVFLYTIHTHIYVHPCAECM